MNRRILGLLAAAIAIVAAIAFAVGGGSGGQSPLDPVAQAANTTAATGSAEVRMAMTISAQGQTIPMSGSGTIDEKNLRAHLTFGVAVPGAGQMSFEEIMAGPVVYVKIPASLVGKVPGGMQWMKIDLSTLAKANGIDYQKVLDSSRANSNPADMLRFLKAVGGSRAVGSETIRGTATTHYKASVDLTKAITRVGDKQTENGLRRLYSTMGMRSMPLDVWVDRSHLVRREAVQFGGNVPGAGNFSMTMTIDYIRFGIPVTDATPPPDNQVFDASSLISRALPGSSG